MKQEHAPDASASSVASDILEMAKQHSKPRVSLSTIAKARAEEKQQSTPAPVVDIHHNAKRVVMFTIAVPFLSTSECYNLLGLNYREGNAAKAEAISKGLIVQHSYHSGKKGGKSVLLEPSNTHFGLK